MNRVKIMLATITLLAFVGGALAFKVKRIGQLYCVRNAALGPGPCTACLAGQTAGAITSFYFTTTTNCPNCTNGNVQCSQLIKIRVEP